MAGVNNTTRKVATRSLVSDCKNNITSSTSFNAGDFLIINGSGLLANPAAESDGVNFAGVSPITLVNGIIPSPYNTDVDAALAIADVPGPTYGDEFLCTAASGASFTPGCAVYLAPSTTSPTGSKNGVTVTGSNKVGIYQGPAFSGDGVTQIVCLLGAKYPDGNLKL